MNRADLGLVLGLSGFLLGGWAVYVSLGAKKETEQRWSDVREMIKSDEDNLAGMAGKLADVDDKTKALSDRVSRAASDPNALWDAVHDLQSRTAVIEAKVGIERKKDK